MSHKRTRVTHMNLLVIGLSVLFCLAVLVAAGYMVSTRTQPVQAAAEPVSLVAEGNVKTGTLNQDPEQYIDDVLLDVALPKGEYSCTAYFDAYRIEDNVYIGRAGAEIKLYVLE